MPVLQHLPYLGTAEDDVLFVEWLVDEGAPVRRGVPLATVETLKAAFEVEAAHDGVLLRRLVAAGERVPAQAAIGVVGEPGERVDEAALQRLLAVAVAPAVETLTSAGVVAPPRAAAVVQPPAAPAARRRATELGIELAQVVGTGPEGLVRVEDVERAHGARARPATPVAPAPVAKAMRAAEPGEGRIDPAFLELLSRDSKAFGALASDFKLALYRRHGACIGGDCRIGDGTVLQVDRLVLGDGAVFGPGTTIEAKELVAGSLLHFGARCRVRCRRMSFGDNAFFTDDIEIGGGGAMDPEAELAVGSHGFVGEHVHLNTARRLAIGDEVVVSRNAVVMTHSFGPSWLQGYPSRFAGVTIGDGAQLGIAAVVFPGVEVGAGAVVLSGSSVVTSVPPGRLFAGVPARDMKAAAQQLSPAELVERAQALVQEFGRQLQLRGFATALAATGAGAVLTVTNDSQQHVLELAPAGAFQGHGGAAECVQVAVTFAADAWQRQPDTVTSIALDPPRIRGALGPLGAAFREFLRKRGVRLHPRAWAYTGGFL